MKSQAAYILMLEDDAEDRYITESYLHELGLNIGLEFVAYPDEVIPFLDKQVGQKKSLPLVILLDKNVPAGSGYEALALLKAHPVYTTVPAVIVSGSGFRTEIEDAYRKGASTYIIKPSTPQLTARKIELFIRYWLEVAELPHQFHLKNQLNH